MPFDAGGVNVIIACALPAVAVPMVGAPGTVWMILKVAVTVVIAFTAKVHIGFTPQPPMLQPAKLEPTCGAAVSVTDVPEM